MADPVTIACPECGKTVNVRAEVLGKKVRCKECEAVFVAQAVKAPAKAAQAAKAAPKPEKPAKPARPADDDEDADDAPLGVTGAEEGYRCPECANEMESPDAIICLHCGYNTQTRERARTRRVHDTTGTDYFIWWLPAIGCILGIIGLIAFDVIYCLKVEDWLDGKEEVWWAELLMHDGFKLWLCIVSAFASWHLGKYAFIRLVLNATPPEVEKHK